MNIPYRSSENCFLTKLEAEHATVTYLKWISDRKVSDLTYAGQFPPSLQQLESWIEGFDNRSSIALAVIDVKTGNHVGNATLNNINWVTRTADLGLMIGDRDFANSAFIEESWRTTIQYAFNDLHLRRLYTGILEPAKEYLTAAKNLGMKHEGTWREQSYVGNDLVDEFLFGIMDDELID